MDLKEFISIIAELNNGLVIYNQDDTESEIVIDSPNIKLYSANNKYYFISKYENDFSIIEENLKAIIANLPSSDIKPYNTYLLLFYNIEDFTDDISKKIIKLEENEFFYKKYVFYYTNSEYDAFTDWFNKLTNKSLSYILSSPNCSPLSGNLHIDFLLRLTIKVPFIHLEFKKMNLKNFDELLNNQLDSMRKDKQVIIQMHDFLSECFAKSNTPEEIAEQLFSDIREVNADEN